MKTCSTCMVEKTEDCFYRTNGGRLEACCKACRTLKFNNYQYMSKTLQRYRSTDKYKAHQKEYQRDYQREYSRNRKKFDSSYKLICNIRSRHSKVIRGVQSSTKGLGCDGVFLREYIQSLFKEGMNWRNYGRGEGKWNIDHILPLSSFEQTSEGLWDFNSDYNSKLIHYSNLQPLWEIENREKWDKIL
jgi:hypothetical protein